MSCSFAMMHVIGDIGKKYYCGTPQTPGRERPCTPCQPLAPAPGPGPQSALPRRERNGIHLQQVRIVCLDVQPVLVDGGLVIVGGYEYAVRLAALEGGGCYIEAVLVGLARGGCVVGEVVARERVDVNAGLEDQDYAPGIPCWVSASTIWPLRFTPDASGPGVLGGSGVGSIVALPIVKLPCCTGSLFM